MLQKLSYFNMTLALVYLLAYLRNGTIGSTSGILTIIVFNWLCIRSYEQDRYQWKVIHYMTGAWSVYFMATLFYGAVNLLTSFAADDFISADTWIYLISSMVFCSTTATHFGCYFYRSFDRF